MIKCELCQKPLSTAQARAGHFRFAHGIERTTGKPSSTASSSFVTVAELEKAIGPLVSKIERLEDALEPV